MKIGFVMDPIENITPHKDSTLAMMLAATDLGHEIFVMGERDLSLQHGQAIARARRVRVFDDAQKWFDAQEQETVILGHFDQIFMRSDPPVDKSYVLATYILDQAAKDGAQIINAPAALRNYNEKLYATHFPDLVPETLVTGDSALAREFVTAHDQCIIKPLDMMGGSGIYLTHKGDVNLDVVLELETDNGRYPVIIQKFLPEIADGDRRVLIIDGKPVEKVLVRLPKQGSIRGNLAAGGGYDVQDLTATDRHIVDSVAPRLQTDGVRFAGLDIIGGKLIEINHTSPTGIREISKQMGENIALRLF